MRLERAAAGYLSGMTEPTPYDESGNVAISDTPGWRYLSIQDDGDQVRIVLGRDADGCRLELSLPPIVQRGVELGEIAKLVIAAQERVDHAKTMGG
jgi:hypothetical protein